MTRHLLNAATGPLAEEAAAPREPDLAQELPGIEQRRISGRPVAHASAPLALPHNITPASAHLRTHASPRRQAHTGGGTAVPTVGSAARALPVDALRRQLEKEDEGGRNRRRLGFLLGRLRGSDTGVGGRGSLRCVFTWKNWSLPLLVMVTSKQSNKQDRKRLPPFYI